MLVDLRMRGRRRDRLPFTGLAAVPTLIILMATVSCSTPDRPQPPAGIVQREPSFPGRVTDAPNWELAQRGAGQQRVRREQPRTSASPKVATVHAP